MEPQRSLRFRASVLPLADRVLATESQAGPLRGDLHLHRDGGAVLRHDLHVADGRADDDAGQVPQGLLEGQRPRMLRGHGRRGRSLQPGTRQARLETRTRAEVNDRGEKDLADLDAIHV